MLNYKISQWKRKEKDVQIPPLREQAVYHFTCLVSVADSDEHIFPSFPRTSAPTQHTNNSTKFSA